MFGNLDAGQMEQLLTTQLLGRLGCHANGVTYVLPISYAYQDGYIYCHSLEGQKLSMLRQNKQLCFQVDDTKDISNWQSVICWGEFEELVADSERQNARAILNARSFPMITSQKMRINPEWPFDGPASNESRGIFFRIRVEEKTGRYEKADIAEHFAS
jgi:nitroimidazol reductase NimA-like FMN-containing flavoprotein (pyridoxamine 5'-phosphate oxidase superfamily)